MMNQYDAVVQQLAECQKERDKLATLLYEWQFEYEKDWHEWVIRYKLRVDTVLAALEKEA